MRLILFDLLTERRQHFHPVALSRPIWELRSGIRSLGEKLLDHFERTTPSPTGVAYFVPPYMAETYRARTERPVNDPTSLLNDDLLLVSARVRPDGLKISATGPSGILFDKSGECLLIRIAQKDLPHIDTTSLEGLIASATKRFSKIDMKVKTWNYIWELVLENPEQLTADFATLGNSGIEGEIEEPSAIRGSRSEVFVAPGAKIHPMAVLDAENGPIYLDHDVEVHPFTRIEGPCYVGRGSILLGAKCREGNSIGPVCRIGGEVEESIIQGYSNKYHDGFLGHAYVGEWVNLGAETTNSDLKNDYSDVSFVFDGKHRVRTGSTKIGAMIGDFTKTSIGCLFNTGAYVGAMTLITTSGALLPKWIPSFVWLLGGIATKGYGRERLFEASARAMARRGCQWTEPIERMWEEIFQMTAAGRELDLDRGRRAMLAKKLGKMDKDWSTPLLNRPANR
jgi:UDP-N-acetylglucosamine diphosphorylase/glucosamine-1-phosphate N-acetyltransferase